MFIFIYLLVSANLEQHGTYDICYSLVAFRQSVSQSVTSRYLISQESCAIAKMTARCDDISKQTATHPPKIM